VNAVAECTLPEKILLAAHQLEESGQSPFSAEALIVTAWQKYPRTFGLKGYTDQYPDSNKILSSLMGEKGLTKRGWLSKVGQKLYSMTREGRVMVRRLRQDVEPEASPPEPVRLTTAHEAFFVQALASSAYQKYREGRKQELTFADACRFWNIADHLTGEALDTRLDQLRGTLAEAERLLGTGHAKLRNGQTVSAEELAMLNDVDSYMEDRFSRHLTLLRSRAAR
jgi:hypothetical protein